jgi:hypothetical protein
VLQVVNATYSTSTTSSTTTYADTGLSASITPSNSSNKILILISHVGLSKGSASGDSAINIRLLRASTSIATLGIDKIKMIGETITSTRSAGKARMPPSIIRRV